MTRSARVRIIADAVRAARPQAGPYELARRIHTALYGRPDDARPPLARAGDAKAARDIGAEIAALTGGYAALTGAPWYPARAGDIVHVHYAEPDDRPGWGETYIVEPAGDGLVLRLLAHTAADADLTGWFAPGTPGDPLMEAWMEAGPGALTIVRDGCVVHEGAR